MCSHCILTADEEEVQVKPPESKVKTYRRGVCVLTDVNFSYAIVCLTFGGAACIITYNFSFATILSVTLCNAHRCLKKYYCLIGRF